MAQREHSVKGVCSIRKEFAPSRIPHKVDSYTELDKSNMDCVAILENVPILFKSIILIVVRQTGKWKHVLRC